MKRVRSALVGVVATGADLVEAREVGVDLDVVAPDGVVEAEGEGEGEFEQRAQGGEPGRLRVDRIPAKAKRTSDPVHLMRLFGLSARTAMHYLRDAHPERPGPGVRCWAWTCAAEPHRMRPVTAPADRSCYVLPSALVIGVTTEYERSSHQ